MPISTANTMRLIIILVLVICLTGLVSSSKKHSNESLDKLAYALNRFNGKLLKALNEKGSNKNLFYSPLSIHMALGMVLPGANRGTKTRKELVEVMSFRSAEDKGDDEPTIKEYKKLLSQFKAISGGASEANGANKTRVDIFTRLVTNKGVEPKKLYLDHIKQNYLSKLSSVSDAKSKRTVVNEINEWGKSVGFKAPVIEKDFFDDKFAAVLITAINLEAFWLHGLHEGPGIFYDLGDPKKKRNITELMGSEISGSKYMGFTKPDDGKPLCLKNPTPSQQQARLSHLRFHAFELGLKDDFKFYIFLPVEQAAGGRGHSKPKASKSPSGVKSAHMGALAKLADDLFKKMDFCSGCKGKGTESCGVDHRTNLETAIRNMEFGSSIGQFRFPKIEFELELNMMETLKLLGVRKALADDSEIGNITKGNLVISEFRHKTMIEATEVGIRAAGLTKVKFNWASLPIINFIVDHPFLYAIYYKQIPLFFGKYVEHPSGNRGSKKG